MVPSEIVNPNITLAYLLGLRAYKYLASIPGYCMGEEEREPGTHHSRMHQVSLVTCLLLRYTKISGNFCLAAEGHTAELYCL